MIKKGAMFGLDARIALAIFGALSVISGAALYSAIKEARATALLTEMQEIGKAWEQYYLDTGNVHIEPINSNGMHMKISGLLETTGETGWNGPYLPYKKVTDYSLVLNSYDETRLDLFTTDNAWGGTASPISSSVGECVSGASCSVWITAYFIKDDSLLAVLDNKVDGGDGVDKGNFRAFTSDSRGNYIYLKYTPIKNPND